MGSVERGGEIWTRCLQILEEHEAMLQEVGLDFKGVVGRGLRDDDGWTVLEGNAVKVDGDNAVGLGLS